MNDPRSGDAQRGDFNRVLKQHGSALHQFFDEPSIEAAVAARFTLPAESGLFLVTEQHAQGRMRDVIPATFWCRIELRRRYLNAGTSAILQRGEHLVSATDEGAAKTIAAFEVKLREYLERQAMEMAAIRGLLGASS